MEKVIADAQEALGTALTTHFKDVLDSHCTELKVQLKSAQIDFVELNKAKLVVERKMKNMLRESKAFDRKITAKDAIITKLKDDVSSLREVLKTQKNEIQNLKRECSSLRAQAETVVGVSIKFHGIFAFLHFCVSFLFSLIPRPLRSKM